MSAHWRLAFRYAALITALAIPVAVGISFLYNAAHAGAFLYGVGMGVVCFVSTALTVSLLTGSSTGVGMVVGAVSFVGRLGFAAVSLGVPAYLGLWPVGTMLIGFVAVYAAENVLLVPWVFGARSEARGLTNRTEKERAEA